MKFGALPLAMIVLSAFGAGCGGDGSSHGDGGTSLESDGPFLPWAEGNTWTYRVTNNGEVSTKVVTIGPEEKVGGSGPHADDLAYRVVTKKSDIDQTVSWQALDGERVLRYREQAFSEKTGEVTQDEHWDPYKLHFDGSEEHTSAKATWLESYDETKTKTADGDVETQTERDLWIVDSVSEEVTVPAGTFQAVVVQKAGGGDVKTYWYVRGIGKVMESGGQTEELVSYKVAP